MPNKRRTNSGGAAGYRDDAAVPLACLCVDVPDPHRNILPNIFETAAVFSGKTTTMPIVGKSLNGRERPSLERPLAVPEVEGPETAQPKRSVVGPTAPSRVGRREAISPAFAELPARLVFALLAEVGWAQAAQLDQHPPVQGCAPLVRDLERLVLPRFLSGPSQFSFAYLTISTAKVDEALS